MCEHKSGYWARVGSSSGPDKENNYTLYRCLKCDTLIKHYLKTGKVVELPKGIGLIPAIW